MWSCRWHWIDSRGVSSCCVLSDLLGCRCSLALLFLHAAQVYRLQHLGRRLQSRSSRSSRRLSHTCSSSSTRSCREPAQPSCTDHPLGRMKMNNTRRGSVRHPVGPAVKFHESGSSTWLIITFTQLWPRVTCSNTEDNTLVASINCCWEWIPFWCYLPENQEIA